MDKQIYIIIIVAVIALFIAYAWNRSQREGFGGPVKRIRRIPRTTCYGICGQYYKYCMSQYQYVDAGDCARRYQNCVSTCNYTDYHRL